LVLAQRALTDQRAGVRAGLDKSAPEYIFQTTAESAM
jgi:hypothetical protein